MSNIDLERAIAASTNRAVPAGGGFGERMAAGAWVRLRARRRRRAIGAGIAGLSAAALAFVIVGHLAGSAPADEAPGRAQASVAERALAPATAQDSPSRAQQPAPATLPAGGDGFIDEDEEDIVVVPDIPHVPDPVVVVPPMPPMPPMEPGRDITLISDLYDVLAAPGLDDLERLDQIAELTIDGIDFQFDFDFDIDDLRALAELYDGIALEKMTDPETIELLEQLSEQWETAPGGDASWDTLRKLYEHCDENPDLDDKDWEALRHLYKRFDDDPKARDKRRAKMAKRRAKLAKQLAKQRAKLAKRHAKQMRRHHGAAMREAEKLRAQADAMRAEAEALRAKAEELARQAGDIDVDDEPVVVDPFSGVGAGGHDHDHDVVVIDPFSDDDDRSGTVKINTTPWAEVYIDGKKIGNTPVIMQVEPGAHVIELRSKDGHKARQRVIVKPGSSTNVIKRFR